VTRGYRQFYSDDPRGLTRSPSVNSGVSEAGRDGWGMCADLLLVVRKDVWLKWENTACPVYGVSDRGSFIG
jgi:hypothetical protein